MTTSLSYCKSVKICCYLQVSVEFADLHDTPGRMQEKGVIAVSIYVSQFLIISDIFLVASKQLS